MVINSIVICLFGGVAFPDFFFVPFLLSLCTESTPYVLSFRIVFFYPGSSEVPRNPPGRKMDGAARGGTAEPTSREQNTRQERG